MFEPAPDLRPKDRTESRAGAISGGRPNAPPLLRPQKRWSSQRRLQILAAAAAAALIFAADVLSPLDGAVAVLYTAVVLLVARVAGRRFVLATGAGCCVLVLIAFASSHWGEAFDGAYVRLGVSLTALAITTLLAVRSWSAEAERRRSEERYGAIFRAAGFAIWEADWSGRLRAIEDLQKAGVGDIAAYLGAHRDILREVASAAKITEANAEAVKLFEAAGREALIGRGMSVFSTPAAENSLAQSLAELFGGAAIVEAETQFRTLRGKTIDVLLRACVVAPEDGWRRMIVTAIDLTERNLTQARLDQTLAELAHASRVALLGQLAASIGHEVNQPLAAITTYAQSGKRWLTREAPNAHEVRDCLEHIAENGLRASEVIAGLKALTKKGAAPKTPLQLAETIEEAVALTRRELATGAVNLKQDLAADLPSALGDRVQIQQVVINLVMNGAQAMAAIEPGRRDLCIAARRDKAGFARISVRDSGDGIKEQNPDAVFEPFFTTKSSGTGMGLSICRSIVEAHGGRIWAENNSDGGATFHFTLPLEEPRA